MRDIRSLADVQKALREIYDKLSRLESQNINISGRRVINASDAVDDGDYITKRQLRNATAELRSIVTTNCCSTTSSTGGEGTPGPPGPPGPAGPPGEDGAGMLIMDEGAGLLGMAPFSSFPARSFLNFVGEGVTATDDQANDRINVTIPGGADSGQTPWLSNIDGANFSLTDAKSLGIGTANKTYPLQVKEDINQNVVLSSLNGSTAIRSTDDTTNSYVPLAYAASSHSFLQGNLGVRTTNSIVNHPLTVCPTTDVHTLDLLSQQVAIGASSNHTAYRLTLGYGDFKGSEYQGYIQAWQNGTPATLLLNTNGGYCVLGAGLNTSFNVDLMQNSTVCIMLDEVNSKIIFVIRTSTGIIKTSELIYS